MSLLCLPLVRFVPCFAAGMLAEYFGSSLIGAFLFAAAAAAAIFLGLKRKKTALCAVGLAAGILLMGLYVRFYCDPILRHSGMTLSGELMICETARTKSGAVRYTASANIDGRRAYISLIGEPNFKEGDTLRAETELYEADPEYVLYNLASGVLLSGKLVQAERLSSGGRPVYRAFKSLRREIMGKLLCYVSGKEAELAAAILFGDDSRLSVVTAEQLRVSGAAHYTVVSGTHFALFSAMLMGLIPKNRHRLTCMVGMITAVVGVLFFGASKSVLRAAAMLILNSSSGMFSRRAEPINSLCAAVLMLTILNPSAILDAGFGMSVLGVLGVSAVGGGIAEKLSEFIPIPALYPIINVFARSICACVCTSPICVALYNGCSVAGAFTTLLLAPLMVIGMFFAILTAVLNSPAAALPVEFSMKTAGYVIEHIGKYRSLWITLDFKAAWILAAMTALLTVLMGLGGMRTFTRVWNLCLFTILFSVTLSLAVSRNRSEIRFVGGAQSSAAIVIRNDEAVIFADGSGGGLAESISRCMREHGAHSISAVIQPEGTYSGAVQINKLSNIVKIYSVYSNLPSGDVVRGAEPISDNAYISIAGMSIASAKVSDSADIVLFSGNPSDNAAGSAKTAVYFSSTEKTLPPNFVNAERIEDFSIGFAVKDGEKAAVYICSNDIAFAQKNRK